MADTLFPENPSAEGGPVSDMDPAPSGALVSDTDDGLPPIDRRHFNPGRYGRQPFRRIGDGVTSQTQRGPLPGRPWSANALTDLSHTHDLVMNWLLLNPHKSMRECADHFGYTQAWLSNIVNCDLFQAALKEKQERIFTSVTQSITEKLKGVADVALDKLATKIEESEDPAYILEVADKTLHRLGYAPASSRNAVTAMQVDNRQVNVTVNSGDLEQARALMRQVGAMQDLPAPQGGATLEHEPASPLPQEYELPEGKG